MEAQPTLSIPTDKTEVPAQSVELIVAEIGLNPASRTKPVIWARNIIIAAGKKYVSTCSPAANASNFESWLSVCPHAVGVMTDGTIRLPQVAEPSDENPIDVLRPALSAGRRAIGMQITKHAIMCLALLAVGVAVVCGVLIYSAAHPFAPGLFKFGTAGVVLVVASLVAGAPAVAVMPQWRRLGRILADLASKNELQVDLASKSTATRPAEQI